MSIIKGEQQQLVKVFSSEYEFHIPEYQRPYAWTEEQAGELYSDLWSFHQEEEKDDEYFLGSIVLIKEGQNLEVDVVDGQQRLTTLTILLSCIAESLQDEESKSDFFEFVREKGNRATNLRAQPRLFLREEDAQFFREHVQEPGGMGTLAQLPTSRFKDSRFNIVANGQLFLGKLGELTEEQILAFGQFIVQRCKLVVVATDSFKSAYRIFSILNDRGLDLEPSDILKARLIGDIPEAHRSDYAKKWVTLEDQLGRQSFNELITHIRMIFQKDKARHSILDEFQTYVAAIVGDNRKLIDEVLIPYGRAFEIVSKTSYQSEDDAKSINDILKWLWRVNNTDWVPVALEFVNRWQDQPDLLLRHLVLLERLSASLFIRGVYATPRIDRYGEVLKSLERGDDLLQPGSKLDVDQDEARQTMEILDGDVYTFAAKRRTFILLRLDSFLADKGVEYDHQRTTIEHVLPQNPKDDSEWARKWTPEQREKWTHRIGNLVLLSRERNSDASNWDFENKKEKYFKTRKGVSLFASSTQVLNHDTWTPTDVEKRQKELLAAIRDGWNLQA